MYFIIYEFYSHKIVNLDSSSSFDNLLTNFPLIDSSITFAIISSIKFIKANTLIFMLLSSDLSSYFLVQSCIGSSTGLMFSSKDKINLHNGFPCGLHATRP